MSPVVDVVVVVFAFVLGTLVGSFLNVVLWRLPRGESIVTPGSHCPSCDTPLEWYELVPVVSWVVLRGRCRTCGVHISARYPLVELGVGVVFGVIAWLLVS
jgi:prepilin signal peptidase PulO-like enzyme (type II secretory pathway)